jgi:iron complex transport system permease protein
MSLPRLLLIVLLSCAPDALSGQTATDSNAATVSVRIVQRSDYQRRFQRIVVPAVVGSGVGLVAGGMFGLGPFYDATGCCGGGDDPGLTSGLMGAVAGATLGSTLGAYVTRNSDNPVSLSRAFTGATVGLAVGVLFGIAGAAVADGDARGLLVGIAIGQGGTAAAFAVPYP